MPGSVLSSATLPLVIAAIRRSIPPLNGHTSPARAGSVRWPSGDAVYDASYTLTLRVEACDEALSRDRRHRGLT